jgi:hypothetical protein
VRIGLLLSALFVVGVAGLRFSGVFPESIVVASLEGVRHLLVMLGLPVAAVILSDTALRDGIQHRTLLYPLLGPVPRMTLALVRTSVTGLLLGTAGCLLLVISRGILGSAGEGSLGTLSREMLAVMVGAMAYTAMFGFIHLLNRRGLITGLALLFLLDLPLGRVPFGIRNLSPSYHVGVVADQLETLALPVQVSFPDSSVALSLTVLVVLAVAFGAGTAFIFRAKNLGELC